MKSVRWNVQKSLFDHIYLSFSRLAFFSLFYAYLHKVEPR